MRLTTLLSLLLMCGIFTVNAQTLVINSAPFQTPVLELYTSEGCNSCPPADRWLGEISRLPTEDLQVLALAYHVDYWDYLGWKDPFASPQYTSRQRQFAKSNGQRSIYTPEFILNGRETRGSHNILNKIREANRKLAPVQLKLSIQKLPHIIDVQLHQLNTLDDLNVEFVVFENNLSSHVNAGENAGSQLQHQQVVRYLSPPLALSKQLHHQIKIKPEWQDNNLGVAVIVRSVNNDFLQSIHSRI